MKVILSVDAVRFPLTGIGRYTWELARNLPLIDSPPNLRLFSGGRFIDRLPSDSGAGASAAAGRGAGIALRLRRMLQNSTLAVRAHRSLLSMRQARALRGSEDAVYHGPQFYLPKFDGPSVATIHDLSVYNWADCHPPGRAGMIRGEIELALERASMLITDSEFTRREVADFFGLPLDRLRAVPLASSEAFRPYPREELAPTLSRHGLQAGSYCLFAGTIEPRKNIDALLDAYGTLPKTLRGRWPLVLCGYEGWRSGQLHSRIEQGSRQGWLKYLGYVAGDDLPKVVAGARLFAFPSLYEGFGLPVLEAMASGVPVVCSDSSSLPEVAGDAAAMCAPEDVDALKDMLTTGLEDEAWREGARERGLSRAAQFSWRRCAEETAAVYRAIAR
ncbi:glycosyltransferase family 4 protein [Zeimonas arvi]|uniref:Glycosyltransferase family 4 protein n=1 Tax=Zeimonas arvi TaxID=2498847 RepID=A0A5C8NZA8_9BURK|nr:glycosyltransferase family 1 protein [Zeimonas arvi]TXL66344.1 glycosyltransferase family 4 protein [Zeimonas arvi]